MCYIVIRRARAADEAARTALLGDCTHEHFLEAFLMFFLHETAMAGAVLLGAAKEERLRRTANIHRRQFRELTLQCVVVAGALLFIFCNASVLACACVVPAAAALVAAGVRVAHAIAATRVSAAVRAELAGWVAEARGDLADEGRPPRDVQLYSEEAARRRDGDGDGELARRVVGTVSLSEWWGAESRGWVHALGVSRAWRRRGGGRALLGAAGGAAHAAGLHSVEAVVSGVQSEARAALHAAGWSLRASYNRALLGAALTLPMVQLGRDLSAP